MSVMSPPDGPVKATSLNEVHDTLSSSLENEDEGTITFNLKDTDLALETSPGSVILDVKSDSGNRGLRLWKDEGQSLVFEFFEVNDGLRRCEVGLNGFESYNSFSIALTWSSNEISLYIGPNSDEDNTNLRQQTSSEPVAQVRRDQNDKLVILGGPGVKLGYYSLKEGGEEVLRPRSKEIFDFTENKSRILLEVAEDSDQFMIETTIVQQIIVMMVTAMETYFEERYIEISSETDISDNEISHALCSVNSSFSPSQVEKRASSQGVSIEELVREGSFNLQIIDNADTLYQDTFDFSIEKYINNSGNRGQLERNIQFRHSIIHEATDMTILNIERVPKQNPIFSNHEHGENLIKSFSETIEIIHQETDRLTESS